MKKWYQENYVSRRDWILENVARLELTPLEVLVLLEIDYNNSNNITNTMELLVKQLNVAAPDLDDAISDLCKRQFLEIGTKNRRICFDISGVFEEHEEKAEVTRDIFDTFETEFGRVLSQKETMQLAEMVKTYDNKQIIKALREATIQNKLNMNYIERILNNWSKNEG